MMKYFLRLAAAAAAGAAVVALAGAGAATAGVHPATPQCQAVSYCVSPDVFADGGVELALAANSGIFQNAPVVTDDASSTSPVQDWHFRFISTIGKLTNYGEGPFQYGLNQSDYASFGDSRVYMLTATPFGAPSNFCLANLNNTGAVLRTCSVHRWQLFVKVSNDQATIAGVPFPDSFGEENNAGEGAYYASVLGANTIIGHNVITGNDELARVTFTFPQGLNQQNWDANDANGG